MMKFDSICRASVVVMTCLALFLSSCDKVEESSGAFDVSIKKTEVTSPKGQLFVNVRCDGKWTLSLVSDEGQVDWAELNVTSGSGSRNDIILSYQANLSESDRELQIVLDNGSKATGCTMIQHAAGAHPDPEPDIPESNVDLTKMDWLELPAMNDPALGYYCHSFEMGGKTYRNYSFGWSQKDRVALWVAYPLCRLYTNGSAGRTNAWALDPILKEDSAAPFSGYAGSYARGHQLPSADRQCSYEANAQTFYGTNMTPQLNEHNEGIWADLENKVRGYANSSDTTYVVTGVIVSASSKTEKDSYGAKVTIPDAYFKAVLKYSKASTLGKWNAAAFFLEHRSYPEKTVGKSHSMSVDRLEEITGIDFFVNLPSKVGEAEAARLEAADPAESQVWW